MIQTLVDNGTIRLGYVSDNDATVIQFPIANTLSLFGTGGSWYLLNRRPDDPDAYAVPASQITTDDRFLYWTVAAYDVAQYGNGECQLQYRIGDVVKMTQKWRTAISASLVDGGVVPTPYETWLDDLAEIADRAEAATEHYPQIGENGNWYVWDVNAGEFVDTGFPSGGTTYNSITETGTAGNYDLELDAHIGIGGNVDGSGSASFAGDIVSGTAVKADKFTGASGGVPITFDAAHGSLDIVNADDGVTVGGHSSFDDGVDVSGGLTSEGLNVLTEPFIIYVGYDSGADEWYAADENGSEIMRDVLLSLYQDDHRTFAIHDPGTGFMEDYRGLTVPMDVIEDISDDDDPSFNIGASFFAADMEDYGGDTVLPSLVYVNATNSHDRAIIQKILAADSDWRVQMSNTTANGSRRVLLSPRANDTTETSGVNKSNKLLFNPSTGGLTVNGTVYNKGISTDGNVTANGDFELGVIGQAYVKGDQNATTLRLYGDTNVYVGSDNDIELHSGSSGKAYYNGEEIATKKLYQLVLDVTADGTQTEYSVSGNFKKIVIYTRMPVSASQPIMYYKIDGTTRGYTQSNSSYARDGMMIADCSEGLLLSQFCPNANAGSVQALQTYPSNISAQTSISTVSFSLSSGTEIPSGTIIKVYAIS